MLTNDTDVDVPTAKPGPCRPSAPAPRQRPAPPARSARAGRHYGRLTLNADGSYQYVVDNTNAAVQALRTSGKTLTEMFTYTMSDAAGATDLAQLTITIQGANDTPVANPDVATAVEAGGLNNGTAGTNRRQRADQRQRCRYCGNGETRP